MIVTKLIFLLIIIIIIINVNAIINRCYLCSQDTLAECVGNNLLYSSNILQYYTEPCNGQCVLFRNKNHSIIRGCSWTYGHMIRKTNGWHEISPGIKAYFCDRYLCNNGTYDQPELSKFLFLPKQIHLLATNNPLQMEFDISHQLHQCYSCTARFQGCGEFLDPHYASKYIRPCPSSCILFRNPNDLNLITRDCGIFWPQINTKSGFHKLLGSDAFFCQESLCNGISFDFIMGIFHHQLPTIIKFPPVKNISITTTNIYNDNVSNESTTSIISNNFTNSFISSTHIDLINTTIIDDLSDLNDTSTIMLSTKNFEEDNWNTSLTVPITRFEYLSVNNNQIDDDIFPSTTPIIDLFTFFPYYFLNNQTKNHLFEYIKPISTLVIPPFSWMLNMAVQNKSLFQNSTITSTTTTTMKTLNPYYEYCKNKSCHHGGRLNSDCLCICLPTFTGDNCETVLCDEEPADICAFILEHECQINSMQYLCPKFCQLDLCILK